jgi:hypothetical protein
VEQNSLKGGSNQPVKGELEKREQQERIGWIRRWRERRWLDHRDDKEDPFPWDDPVTREEFEEVCARRRELVYDKDVDIMVRYFKKKYARNAKGYGIALGVIGTIAIGLTWYLSGYLVTHQSVYDRKHQAMEKFLAEETRDWYYGEHGETLTAEQYDWAYNEASDALQAIGNATSK